MVYFVDSKQPRNPQKFEPLEIYYPYSIHLIFQYCKYLALQTLKFTKINTPAKLMSNYKVFMFSNLQFNKLSEAHAKLLVEMVLLWYGYFPQESMCDGIWSLVDRSGNATLQL